MSNELILLAVLLVLSGFFSGAEIAIFSLSRIRVRTLVEKKIKHADLVARLKRNPQKILITILVGNNLVNIGASSLATLIAIDYFGSKGAGIAIGIMTFLILVFGEMLPKAIATHHAEKFSLRIAPILRLLLWTLAPVIWVLELFLRFFMLFVGAPKKTPVVTEEELKTMMDVGVEEGQVEKKERELIERVFEFNDITAKEVMTPKKSIFMLNSSRALKGCVAEVVEMGYSRIPIYEKNKDSIVGIVFIKDILGAIAAGKKGLRLKDIMAKPHVIPEDKIIDELFKDFQMKHMHMALVVNEYGEITGLVTLEDLLEELVGEIIDESDIVGEMIMRIDKRSILVNGDAKILDIEHFLHVNISTSKRVTIAKFLLRKLGHVPKEGKKLELPEVTIFVKDVNKYTIKRVKIIKKNGG